MISFRVASVGMALMFAVSCGDEQMFDEPQMAPKADQSAVQSSFMNNGYELARDDGPPVTGALFVPKLDANGNPRIIPGTNIGARATCGVTFISPHYAITAAHCVSMNDIVDPKTKPVVVESYDIRLLSNSFPLAVQGTFPNYTHDSLRTFNGYRVKTYKQCYVMEMCVGTAAVPSYNCDLGVDIALIKCLDRSAVAPFIDVAPMDSETGPVEMYWFHEVLDMPIAKPQDNLSLDHYEHYWFRENEPDNYHYHPNNDLLPLHSTPWNDVNKTPRTRIRRYGSGVQTDLFGCHGSSGSGVMQRTSAGTLQLLGPAMSAGNGWRDPDTGRSLLCSDPQQISPGTFSLTYTNSQYSRVLAAHARSDPAEGLPEWVAWFTVVNSI